MRDPGLAYPARYNIGGWVPGICIELLLPGRTPQRFVALFLPSPAVASFGPDHGHEFRRLRQDRRCHGTSCH